MGNLWEKENSVNRHAKGTEAEYPNVKNKFRKQWLQDEDWVEPRHHSHKKRKMYKDRRIIYSNQRTPNDAPYPYFSRQQIQKGWQNRKELYEAHKEIRFLRRKLDRQRWPLQFALEKSCHVMVE